MKKNKNIITTIFLIFGVYVFSFGEILVSGEEIISIINGQKTYLQLSSTTPAHTHFGYALSVSGEFAVISAPSETIDSVMVGAVYIYEKKDSEWELFQKILSDETQYELDFGATLKIENNTLVIGSPRANGKTGVVEIYEFVSTQWVKVQTLQPNDLPELAHFGKALDLKGSSLLISTLLTDDSNSTSGRVYVYEKNVKDWEWKNTILSPKTGANDLFASCVKIISPAHILVSAPMGNGINSKDGIVYSFTNQLSGWKLNQTITTDYGRANGLFGCAMDYANNNLVVGSMQAMVDSFISGDAVIYTLDDFGKFNYETRIIPHQPYHHDYFGATLAINDEYMIVGSPRRDLGNDDNNHGTAFVFQNIDNQWIKSGQISPNDLNPHDHFGSAFALEGKDLVIGSHLDNNNAIDDGSAYFYKLNELPTATDQIELANESKKMVVYPNPFKGSVIIEINLSRASDVKLTVYDLSGKVVAELLNLPQLNGTKQVVWGGINDEGNKAAPGTYLCKLQTKTYEVYKQLLMTK